MSNKKKEPLLEEMLIHDELDSFITKMIALQSAFEISSISLHQYHEKAKKDASDFYKHFVKKNKKGRLELADEAKYNTGLDIKNRVSTSHIAEYEVIPESLLITLVSVFDNFLLKLLKKIYINKPELYSRTTETMSLNELRGLSDYPQVINYLVNKEIQTFLRTKNHSSQFDSLEEKFGLPLKKDLYSWGSFIEITERRNLIVHNDGLVNEHYIITLKQLEFDVESIKIGDELGVDSDYFNHAYDCLFEIGVKLAYVLYNKTFPDHSERIIHNLIMHTCYDLLLKKQYKLAQNLLSFALLPAFKKHDSDRKYININLALAHKLDANIEKALNVIGNEDWTASSDLFQLAVCIIKDDYVAAEKIMLRLGTELSKKDYMNWPLFTDFRKTQKFSEIFKKVFKQKYSENVEDPSDSE